MGIPGSDAGEVGSEVVEARRGRVCPGARRAEVPSPAPRSQKEPNADEQIVGDPSPRSGLVEAGAVTAAVQARAWVGRCHGWAPCQPQSALGGACVESCRRPLQVEDPLPPVCSGTPKGSGAGYGVGFDLEEFLNQSFDMGVADGPQDG